MSIKIENVDVYGFEASIRGMRSPMNSWEKSDSGRCLTHGPAHCSDCIYVNKGCNASETDLDTRYIIGLNDLDLMTRLRNAGTDHRKFMRMITVYTDITAPLYWWKQHDQYKVGTTTNSCSTMHKITEKEFTLEDFSTEHLLTDAQVYNGYIPTAVLECTIGALNEFRELYLKTKDKKYWWQIIQILPSSYNQKRTVMLNYEVLANIYKSRKNHKLDEWKEFCDWIETLPYSELITGEGSDT